MAAGCCRAAADRCESAGGRSSAVAVAAALGNRCSCASGERLVRHARAPHIGQVSAAGTTPSPAPPSLLPASRGPGDFTLVLFETFVSVKSARGDRAFVDRDYNRRHCNGPAKLCMKVFLRVNLSSLRNKPEDLLRQMGVRCASEALLHRNRRRSLF